MSRPPTQLVRASDIARARIAALPSDTFEERTLRMLRYYTELMRASDEKHRGEWRLPD